MLIQKEIKLKFRKKYFESHWSGRNMWVTWMRSELIQDMMELNQAVKFLSKSDEK